MVLVRRLRSSCWNHVDVEIEGCTIIARERELSLRLPRSFLRKLRAMGFSSTLLLLLQLVLNMETSEPVN